LNDDPHLKGVNAVFGGVSTVWLSKAFRIPKAKVERKLISLKPIGQGTGGAALYDLVDAAGYLATPQTGIAEYLKTIKPEQLPEKLRESYWNSMIKKQKWEEKARHLWRTEDVLEAMGDVFKLIRTTLQILPDDIHRAMPLTPEQRVSVTRVIEGRYLDAGLLEHCGCCFASASRAWNVPGPQTTSAIPAWMSVRAPCNP
jgi:hypothetical protein